MSSRRALHTGTVASEATRYLEVVDLFRSVGIEVRWRAEDEEIRRLILEPRAGRPSTCGCCASPLVRINGWHVCLGR